jgi:hypothetical protein
MGNSSSLIDGDSQYAEPEETSLRPQRPTLVDYVGYSCCRLHAKVFGGTADSMLDLAEAEVLRDADDRGEGLLFMKAGGRFSSSPSDRSDAPDSPCNRLRVATKHTKDAAKKAFRTGLL